MSEIISDAKLRTKKRLRIALAELIRKKGSGKISVSDLVEEANLTRATFYSYYDSFESFYEEEFTRAQAAFAEQIVTFLTEGKENARESSKKHNLIITSDERELLSALLVNRQEEFISIAHLGVMFNAFYEIRFKLFSPETLENCIAK